MHIFSFAQFDSTKPIQRLKTYEENVYIYMFFKCCVGFVLSNCLNAKKKIHLELGKRNTS